MTQYNFIIEAYDLHDKLHLLYTTVLTQGHGGKQINYRTHTVLHIEFCRVTVQNMQIFSIRMCFCSTDVEKDFLFVQYLIHSFSHNFSFLLTRQKRLTPAETRSHFLKSSFVRKENNIIIYQKCFNNKYDGLF